MKRVLRAFSTSPKPFPLPPAEQKEFLRLIKDAEKRSVHPDFVEFKSQVKGEINEITGEIGGPKGKEPTRYGDWERNGRAREFLIELMKVCTLWLVGLAIAQSEDIQTCPDCVNAGLVWQTSGTVGDRCFSSCILTDIPCHQKLSDCEALAKEDEVSKKYLTCTDCTSNNLVWAFNDTDKSGGSCGSACLKACEPFCDANFPDCASKNENCELTEEDKSKIFKGPDTTTETKNAAGLLSVSVAIVLSILVLV